MCSSDLYVVPTYESVRGEAILFTVLEEPVTKVEFINRNLFPINGELSIIVKVTPDNATYPDVALTIVDKNNIGAALRGNILTATKTGTVVIRAESGEVSATQTIYAEPASDKEIEVIDIALERSEFSVSRSLTLVAITYPSDAV